MVYIGIDPSLNSTGICVLDGEHIEYHVITPHATKNQKSFGDVVYHEYTKLKKTKSDSYADIEKMKTQNLNEILEQLRPILAQYNEAMVLMEGISYGSIHSAAVMDLAGLNFTIRIMCMQMGISIHIASPMEVKKFAVGNGGAKKEQMIDAWERVSGIRVPNYVKVDDIADAYFMAQMCSSLYSGKN